MAMCPLCSERTGKRYCPAKDAQICAACCGTKREIEIDCPASCPYLRASRSYEAEKRIPDAGLAAKVQKYDNSFVYRYREVLDAVSRAVAEGGVRLALFRRLKSLLDEMMQPSPSGDRRILRVSEVMDVLDFLTFAAQINSSVRPRSRRYLDWISETSGHSLQAQQSSGLIIP